MHILRHRLRCEKEAYSFLKYAGHLIKIYWYVLRSYFGILPHKQIFIKLFPWFWHLVVQSVERSKVFVRIYDSLFWKPWKHYMIIPMHDLQPDCGHAIKKMTVCEVWWLLGGLLSFVCNIILQVCVQQFKQMSRLKGRNLSFFLHFLK